MEPAAQSIHHEVAEAVAPIEKGLSPTQLLELQAEVGRLLDREHKLLRSFGTVALGILTALGGLLTFLGFTTVKDIRGQTTSIVRGEVDGLIGHIDSETNVKQRLDDLVGRSVMTASLLALRRPEPALFDDKITLRTAGLTKALNLSFDDWTYLRKWVQHPSLDQQDFSDTVSVLAAQDKERRQQDAREFLAEMLNPSAASPLSWMKNQPTKRLAILRNFLWPGLEYPAVEIASAQENPPELRMAALEYIRAVHYRDGFDKLFLLTGSSGNDKVALRALSVCASLDPLNERIKQEIDKTIEGAVTLPKVERAISLGTASWYALSPVSEGTPAILRVKVEEEQLQNAKKLLSYAVNNQSRVVVLDDGTIVAIFVRREGENHEVFGVGKEVFSQFDPYWDLLKDAASQHNVKRISVLAPWSAFQRGLNALQVDLSDTASISVSRYQEGAAKQETTELSASRGVGRVVLARARDAELHADDTMTVLWTDGLGRSLQGKLVGLSGSGFMFKFAREFY